jgi:hypothetical protein
MAWKKLQTPELEDDRAPASSVIPALCRDPRRGEREILSFLLLSVPLGGSRHKAGMTLE